MASEKKDSSEYFMEDGEYVNDSASEAAADGGIEEEEEEDDDYETMASVDNEGGGVSRDSSLVSQQWPQSIRYRVCDGIRFGDFCFLNAVTISIKFTNCII